MKLKYYLRGMGVGVVVTAIIFMIAFAFYKPSLSQDELELEARKLGMVYESEVEFKPPVVADATPIAGEGAPVDENSLDDTTNDIDADATAEDESNPDDVNASDASASNDASVTADSSSNKKTDKASDSSSNDKTDKATDSSSQNQSTKTSDNKTTGKTNAAGKEFKVAAGNSSFQVAKNLTAMGLVDDASKFDQYLSDHHYDNRIHTGTFQIPENATYEDIAKILTSK